MYRQDTAKTLGLLPLIARHATETADQIAITAPGYQPLSYARLHALVADPVQRLHDMGVNRHDPVAIVLPNGPAMAVAFLAISTAAISAPLNPGYSAQEFSFYLSDIAAKAVVVDASLDSPARKVAAGLGIPIIELKVVGDEAGHFYLSGNDVATVPRAGFAEADDVALILHTSGTTSTPKMVPLTHENILASALNISTTLKLNSQDRCLNVMPLFHIHGLVAALVSSVYAGASLVCTPGFEAELFYDCLETFQPTWYTAVPTIHQAVLAAASHHQDIIAEHTLRFLRSSSASLPAKLKQDLEETFKVPVIEAYGMTEASHQIASNPLPPKLRKPGSVGIAAGPEVAIMADVPRLLRAGEVGEIVIRGLTVTSGYANNPAANNKAFSKGWFRTGDQGYIDADGYLYITGRLKEMINRGGESIAPREIDDALLAHPEVVQAVAFAVPHESLGEDIAAAVILQKGSTLSERELRQYAFSRLLDSKVPSQIIIVQELPKGPSGKLQRLGLAEKFAEQRNAKYVSPSNTLEQRLTEIWTEVLGQAGIGIHDNFFALGGDSLRAGQVVSRVRATFQIELALASIFQEPVLTHQAAMIGETLLAEIEALTDEEAQQLMSDSKEDNGSQGG